MTGDTASERTPRKRRSILLLALTCLVVSAGITGMLVVRTGNPDVSSEWPRPYDPTKPFNMLGVPGVSVEQRKRAEDLLVRSLKEAPRWSDYQAAVDAGWNYTVLPSAELQEQLLEPLGQRRARSRQPSSGATNGSTEAFGFEHIVNPLLLNDGRMLDPQYPETLMYKIRNGERTFVAYLYVVEPDIQLDDPRIAGFAGRLIEWHDHSDMCWQGDDDPRTRRLTGFKSADGACPTPDTDGAEVDTEYVVDGPSLESLTSFLTLPMAHVWVVDRFCGPFSGIEGPLLGVSTTPTDERVDICEH